jgi:hypothetical protein
MIDERAHQRIDQVENTLKIHSEHIESLKEISAEQTSELKVNTKLTQEVADNTAELVDLFKGAKVFSRLVIWLAATGAGLITLINYFKD